MLPAPLAPTAGAPRFVLGRGLLGRGLPAGAGWSKGRRAGPLSPQFRNFQVSGRGRAVRKAPSDDGLCVSRLVSDLSLLLTRRATKS